MRKVQLADDHSIPPLSEKIICVYVQRDETGSNSPQYLLEPCLYFLEKNSLIMPRCLVDTKEVNTKVRIMHSFIKTVKIYQNTWIGRAEEVEGEIIPIPESLVPTPESTLRQVNTNRLPASFQNIYKTCLPMQLKTRTQKKYSLSKNVLLKFSLGKWDH